MGLPLSCCLVWCSGAVETLEADVRSKFQTKQAIRGIVKLLPFDELTIRCVVP
jgi:hypothetical protein